MKNLKYILLTIVLLSNLSCKDFLETESPFGASVVSFYSNEEEADIALTSCYNILNADFDQIYGLNIDALGMYCGDLAQSGRTTELDYTPFESNAQTGAENTLDNIWKKLYSGIYRCNIFLEKVEGIDFSEPATKNRMIAEATFLRGYFYFELTKIFGDVPLVLEVLTADESYAGRDPKAQVMAQIETDWLATADVLPLKSEYSPGNAGRITKGTVQGYLTKFYVYEKRWQEAISWADQLIASGEYGLHEEYFDNFEIAHENGLESIFEVQCKSFTDSELANCHYDLEAFEGTTNPRGFTAPSTDYYNSFQQRPDGTDDPRADLTCEFSIISVSLFTSVKYNRPQDPQPTEQYDGELNYKLMRYADFLLLYAEALNESGQTDAALAAINQIRERPSVGLAALSGLSQADTRQAIYDERKWELGLEGHRFYDLVRWGIAGEVIRGLGRPFTDGVHEIMPIPLSELDLNQNLTQNPGY